MVQKTGNRLSTEKSPYLRQHAENPVNWYPWCDEAFERARKEDKPILVSIGYSTCHWCHVMARESFEDPETARIMNENFISIKVDREEHPDIDSLYMKAVQAISGQSGWPLNVFIAPDGTPFYGGTYFPPYDSFGLPSFKKILLYVSDAYRKNRKNLDTVREAVKRALAGATGGGSVISPGTADRAVSSAAACFDATCGGFGGGPKFPHAMLLKFLLLYYRRTGNKDALDMVEKTLDAMAEGGIYDHIGGGFHRYSVDERWAVPHFEKMLYDNALLLDVYSMAHGITGSDLYRVVAEETAGFLLREMRSPEGGFYAALDADVDGVEGRYYLWTIDEIRSVLGEGEAERFSRYFSMTEEGNFEGKNVLRVDPDERDSYKIEELKSVKKKLLQARKERKKPARDEKVIVAWNGLAARALTGAGESLGRADLLEAARRCAAHIMETAWDGTELCRYIMEGAGHGQAVLEDYGLFGSALLDLRKAGGGKDLVETAEKLARRMETLFFDPVSGLFYDTPARKDLFVRERDLADSDIPSGGSAAAGFFLALSHTTGKTEWRERALSILRSTGGMADNPLFFGCALSVLESFLSGGEV